MDSRSSSEYRTHGAREDVALASSSSWQCGASTGTQKGPPFSTRLPRAAADRKNSSTIDPSPARAVSATPIVQSRAARRITSTLSCEPGISDHPTRCHPNGSGLPTNRFLRGFAPVRSRLATPNCLRARTRVAPGDAKEQERWDARPVSPWRPGDARPPLLVGRERFSAVRNEGGVSRCSATRATERGTGSARRGRP